MVRVRILTRVIRSGLHLDLTNNEHKLSFARGSRPHKTALAVVYTSSFVRDITYFRI